MESIRGRPDPAEALEALTSIDEVQRAVRDTPWPTWLYPVNAVLLSAMALAFLLPEHRIYAHWTVAITIVAVNLTAGYRMGTPWALPNSRGFLAAVAVSGLCVLAARITSDLTNQVWPAVALAAAAATTYLAGSVAHRRSTGPPR